jgi:hypothetical protein
MTTTKTTTLSILSLSILAGAEFLHSAENRRVSLKSLRRVKEGDLFTAILATDKPGVHETALFVCEARASVKGRDGYTSILARPVGRANAAVREFTFTVSSMEASVLLVRRTSDGAQGESDDATEVKELQEPGTKPTPKLPKSAKTPKAEKRASVSTPVQPERSVGEILTMVAEELPEPVPAPESVVVAPEPAPLSMASLVEGIDASEPMASPLDAGTLSAEAAPVVAEEPVQWINPALVPTTLFS